jgi:SAM-dependent methyltransferase
VNQAVRRLLRHPGWSWVKRAVFFGRGLAFVGRRYVCPCCGWSLRGFVGRWGLVSSNKDGYCPRCNAKARHRRIWIHLEQSTRLSSLDGQVLEVAPWWSFARRLQRMPNIRFVGMDLERSGPQVTVVGDALSIPFQASAFDLVLCVHVLEHIADDRRVMAEMHRVLKPGGVAVVSVPLRLDQPTYEDPTIMDPEQRARVFGERGHVRWYGRDLGDRLAAAGFQVTLDLASDVPENVRTRYGLRNDENIFHCTKSTAPSPLHRDFRNLEPA